MSSAVGRSTREAHVAASRTGAPTQRLCARHALGTNNARTATHCREGPFARTADKGCTLPSFPIFPNTHWCLGRDDAYATFTSRSLESEATEKCSTRCCRIFSSFVSSLGPDTFAEQDRWYLATPTTVVRVTWSTMAAYFTGPLGQNEIRVATSRLHPQTGLEKVALPQEPFRYSGYSRY